MKIQHTPGPWKAITEDGNWRIRSEKPDHIAIISWAESNGQANARLIAAAPELLEALEKMASMAMHAPLIGHNYDQSDIDDAFTAIAKARGEFVCE